MIIVLMHKKIWSQIYNLMETFIYNKFSYIYYVDVAKKFEPKYI